MNDDGFIPGFIFGAIIAALLGAFVVSGVNSYWHDEAVKHNKAEFYLDQNNERQWRWKE